MKEFASKANQKKYSILTPQEMIAYEKFQLAQTRRAVSQTQQANMHLDQIIAKLEASLAEEEQQIQYYESVIQRNNMDIRKINEESSEQKIWRNLKPKMEQMEQTTNILVSKKHQYETSCTALDEVKAKLADEQRRCRQVEEQVKGKQYQLERVKKEIEEEDKQINRLLKILSQYESQNEEMFTLKKKLNNDLQEVKGNIRVYCRVRPAKQGNGIINVTSDNTLKITYERERNRQQPEKYEQGYVFEQIFDQKETQHTIFTELSQLIQSAIDGKNVCIFAYGQTGSGKTFTLLGPESYNMTFQEAYEHRGLANRSMDLIFRQIQQSRKFRWNFKAFLSIQEIYLENIIDLVKTNDIAKQKDKCVEVEVSEVEEVLAYMKEAMINRKKAATNMNERSSRSHLIITLRLEGFSEKNDDKRFGSLVFVDLAGSQRLKTSKVEGHQLKETQFINKSLSALGTVINQMRKNSEHVSFRNSKLTHVLQRYLEGDSKTLMFVNVSPDLEDMNQTKISLGFAEGVRDVKMKK